MNEILPKPLRIGFSAMLTEKGQSGIGQYTLSLLEHLERFDTTNTYFIFGIKGDSTLQRVHAKNFTFILFHPIFFYPVFNVLWHWVVLPWFAWKFQLHLVHLPTHRRLCVWAPVPTVATVHDLAAVHQPEKYGRLRHWYMKTLLTALLHNVTFIIAVSKSTFEDMLTLNPSLGTRAAVVYNGLDHATFRPLPREEIHSKDFQDKYQIHFPFILYVSRIEHPGKNHVRLIQAFALLKKQKRFPHHLVLVGGPWNGAELVYEAARNSVVASQIHFAGFVVSEDLPLFYNQADIVVVPSLWEGFGFPVLEAMACGASVACSNVGSLPEVGGGVVHPFNPLVHEAIGEAMASLLDLPEAERQNLRAKGIQWAGEFSWHKTASETLSVYIKVLRGKK